MAMSDNRLDLSPLRRLLSLTPDERREMWRERVEMCRARASGQSVAAWCRENDVKEHQLWYWMKRFKKSDPTSPQWIPVAMQEEGGDQGLLIRIGKLSVEVQPGFDRELLAGVIEVLSAQC